MSDSRFADIRSLITARFQAGFVAAAIPPADPLPFLPTQYDNMPFTTPQAAPWARFHTVEGERQNAAVGVEFQRSVGVIYLQVFLPEGSGTKTAYDAGDVFAAVFDNADFGAVGLQIICRTVSVQRIGKNGEGWMQFNAWVTYQADATPEV